jgi:hypothetical protein
LKHSNLNFHKLSWVDPAGRLFWCNQQLYRGIGPKYAALYSDLFRRGIIDELIDKQLLVETWLADCLTADFPLVLQHRVLPVVSYAPEWSGSHFKAAALLVLDLEIALRPHGLTLEDINPWNLVFDRTTPLYVDFCSIAPLADQTAWSARTQFEEFFLNPLRLFVEGMPRVGRRLLCDPWLGITSVDLERLGVPSRGMRLSGTDRHRGVKQIGRMLLPGSLHPFARGVLDKGRLVRAQWREPRDRLPEIIGLRDRISAISVSMHRTPWAGYYTENFPDFDTRESWTNKHHAVTGLIEACKPATLIDIGANRGWYSQAAARRGVRVIGADSDETSVNELFDDVNASKLDIFPIFLDIRFPEPAQGPGYGFFASAAERFKSEMVLALGLVHHLTFRWHLSFDHIVDALTMFTTKWLTVEFIGPDDSVVKRIYNCREWPFYTYENFRGTLEKRFEIIRQLPSDNGGLDAGVRDDRTIVLCKIRN